MKKHQNKFYWFLCLMFLSSLFLIPAQVWAKEDVEEELFQKSFQELMEIEITVATRSPKTIKWAPATASVITAEQIMNMGARSLTEVLVTIPGFGLQTSQGWARSEIEVRGIGGVRNSEKVLIMVDGHKLNDPFFGGATTVTDDFPLENVKQIEIIRGPGSALYGANAFTAAINIVTKRSEDIGGLQVNLGKGSFNTSRYNILYGKEINDVRFSLNLNYFDTDSERRKIEKDELTGAGASEAPGSTNHHRERYDIQVNVDYKDLGFMVRFINKEQGALVGPRDHLGDDNLFKFNALYSEIYHTYNFTKETKLLNKIYYDRFDLDFFFELFPEGTTLGATTFPEGVLYQGIATENTVGYNLQLDHELFSDNILTTGFNIEYVRQTNVTTRANSDPRPLGPDSRVISPTDFQDVTDFANFNKPASRTILAFYIQDDWKIIEDLSLILGVRSDHYNDVGDSTNPRVALVYSPTTDLDLKLLYGTAFRVPNFEELYNQNNKGVVGNSDLDPEKLQTLEAGLGYRFSQRYHLSLNVFYTEINDLIALGPPDPSNSNLRTYKNLNDVESRGGEAELKINFENKNYAYLNYSYQHSIDSSTKRKLPNVPEHRGNIGVNLALGKYVNIHPHAFMSGKRLRDEDDPRSPLGGYALFNLTIIAKNFYKNLEARVSIHNLLDKKYVHPANFTLPDDYPQQGRDFFLDFYYKF